MKIKGAVFDMDGLMFDTEKLLVRFWKESARSYGYNMTDENVFEIRSLSRKYSIPLLKGIFGEDFPFNEVRSRRITLMNEYIDTYGFYVKKGLFELLDFLKENNYLIAVATATDRERAECYLKKTDVYKYFNAVICGDMVRNGKPEPDIYLTATAELGLPPEVCVAFEDSPNGIKSAYSAGCKVIMIPDLTQPDDVIKSMLSGVYESLDKAVDFFTEV
ncbi:MAG: HAD family phosphatase [Prevotella sp.]|nr:HAD family phosphatase [Alistipes senegalensis]MCM1358300.1 HAD family phosphatase [Prevotella sp.]MCM1472909.1 HAD family phosphatase [Muribaculaceae bacterium]